ncbi:MAG: trypsin-like peptidase domain-containing protein [Novosphingobium sp.]
MILLVAMVMPASLSAEPSDITAASRSVVRVVLIERGYFGDRLVGHGSGFAVSSGEVVTNAHVVAPMNGNTQIYAAIVPSQGKGAVSVQVVSVDGRADLALLRIVGPSKLTPSTLFSGASSAGQEIWAVGYPGNVDRAQGMSADDYLVPTPPVIAQGNISARRPSQTFDGWVHTAQIAAGNSGGPVYDACGRVIGVNSQGTVSGNGTDSNFYFAISMRELSRFLLTNGVKTQTMGQACQSLSEFRNSEEQRRAGELAQQEKRAAAEKSAREEAKANASRKAEMAVMESRENRMAMAGLVVLLALGAGGAAYRFGQNGKPKEQRMAAAGAAVLALAAVILWLTRPGMNEVDALAAEIVASSAPSESASAAASPATEDGSYICTIDSDRSRVTVSNTADVPLTWKAGGCVNGKTQYGLNGTDWKRVLAPNSEDTVSVASYDPATRTYRTERWLLDAETMAKVRETKASYAAPSCGKGDDAARQLGDAQQAVLALLPADPNEKLVYSCTPKP